MCTAFVHKGKDIIYGFNMDINEGAVSYDIYAMDDWFCIGCSADMNTFEKMYGAKLPNFYCAENGIRKIHGVNRNGVFTACLNNMNFYKAPFRLTEEACSIDQLMDDLISGRRSVMGVRRFAEEKEIVTIPYGAVDVPNPGFHSISADAEGNILLLEPGNGYAVVKENYAVLTNFSLLEPPYDFSDEKRGYYGKDRYDKALDMLRRNAALTPEGGLKILQATRQTGPWATRVSFVYSCNENRVYYCREGDFGNIRIHQWKD